MQKTFEILFALSPFILIVFLVVYLLTYLIKKIHKGFGKYPTYWLVLTIGGLFLIAVSILHGTRYPEAIIGVLAVTSANYQNFLKLLKKQPK